MRFPRIMLALVAALLLGGCQWPVDESRTRITVEVDTPEGLKTGTSVWQTKTYKYWTPLAAGYNNKVRGDAVVVDIGGRKLFAVLVGADGDPNYGSSVMGDAIRWTYANGDILNPIVGEKGEELERSGERIELPRKAYPLLVAFSDIRDPQTVFQVDPDDLETPFGPRVRLSRITAQYTHDKVNSGLDEHLPWFDEFRDKYLRENPNRSVADPIDYLKAESFARGR